MRTPEDMVANPQIGDVLHSYRIGLSSRHLVIWWPCPKCGKVRWVHKDTANMKRICRKCYAANRISVPRPPTPKTIKSTDIPKQGDIIHGRHIGRRRKYFQWVICPSCHTGRWVSKSSRAGRTRCTACGNLYKKGQYIGEKSSQWKGGKIVSRYGYIYVRVYPDSPFHPMVNYIGYVAEHRLVMAQHLGRPLERWEIVHHKHVRFAAGTIENKQDNRIDNLELVSNKVTHDAITILENRIHELEQQVSELKSRLAAHEAVDDITKGSPSEQKGSNLMFRVTN